MAKKLVVLIDGSAAMFRAYYAMPSLTNAKGLPTGAVYGFAQILQKVVRDLAPDLVAVVFDRAEPTFRKEMFEAYKANRKEMPEDLAVQIPYIKRMIEAFNLTLLEQAGYEADDLMGAVARRAEREGYQVLLVTGDKDMLQLVTDHVALYDPVKDKRLGAEAVRERYGVTPDKVVEVMGLSGDTSDNIPGVPGIGEKTASALIQEFGSLEEVIRRVDEVKGEKRRENIRRYADQARLSKKLATIDTEVKLEFDWHALVRRDPDPARLRELFKELDFRKLLEQYVAEAEVEETAETGRAAIDRSGYEPILTKEALRALAARLRKAGRFAMDSETTSLDPMRAEIVGLSFADAPGAACYVPIRHNYLGAPKQLSWKDVTAELGPILADPKLEKIGQNIKYDWICLAEAGATLAGVAFDTMVAAWVLDPGRASFGMDALSEDLLGHATIKYGEVTGKGRNQVTFDQVEVERAVAYAAEDADVTLRLEEKLRPELEAAGLAPLYHDLEMPLVEVLVDVERAGVRVDADMLREMSKEFETRIERIVARIYRIAGTEFNVNSPKQLGGILFDKLGMPVVKKTKTGASTDVDVLETLAASGHELPKEILDYRALQKLKSTYVDALPTMINPKTGRIHTSFQQTAAATGRLSSTDPNLQNIPVRTEEGRRIRQAFVPAEGTRFLSADYSQVELRLLAHICGDEALREAFRAGEDIHRATASQVFGVEPDQVDGEMRRRAKAVNFGIIYGVSPFGLARNLGIGQPEAKAIIDRYFSTYPGVKRYMEETIQKAKKDGFVTTLLGRRRFLPELKASNAAQRGFGERMAINTPIQGTAADLIKRAMIRIHRRLRSENLKTRMILQVHDELLFEVPPKEEKALAALVREEMEGALDLSVALTVDMNFGANWSEAH